MIPLDKIGEYTLVCERFNIECSIQNKLDMLEAVRSYLQGYISLGNPSMITGITKQELLAKTVPEALRKLDETKERWSFVLTHLDDAFKDVLSRLLTLGIAADSEAFKPYAGKNSLMRFMTECCGFPGSGRSAVNSTVFSAVMRLKSQSPDR